MTTFSDQLFQFGGVPAGMGVIPITKGNYWFVDYGAGSDGNSGKSLTEAFKTLEYAVSRAVADDVILLTPNATHVLSAMLSITANRIHIVGLVGSPSMYGQRVRISLTSTVATDIATIQVTGQACTFTNLKIMNNCTNAAALWCVADGGEYTIFRNCEMYKESLLNSTEAAELMCNGDSSQYINCTIGSTANAISGAIKRPCVNFSVGTLTGKVARDVYFEGCLFWRKAGNAANIFIDAVAANDIERMCLFKDCTFINNPLGTGMTNAITSNLTDGSILLKNCAGVNFTGWATATTNKLVYIDQKTGGTTTDGIGLIATHV
jgi:hypothetical protein